MAFSNPRMLGFIIDLRTAMRLVAEALVEHHRRDLRDAVARQHAPDGQHREKEPGMSSAMETASIVRTTTRFDLEVISDCRT